MITLGTRYEKLRVPLAGAHQAVNAAVAVAALSDLRRDYPRLDDAALRRGLAATRWPGRLQRVTRDPLLILDAAHNRESAAALAGALQRLYPGQPFMLVVAVFRDKSARDVLEPLLPLASYVVVTAADHPRALPSADLAAVTRALIDEDREARLGHGGLEARDPGRPKSRDSGILIEDAPSVAAALERARMLAGPTGRVLVTGSLRTVGEAMIYLEVDATDN